MEHDPPLSIDYQAFLESTPLVPWELDSCSGRMSYVGPQAVGLLGHPVARWLEPSFWSEHVFPDDQASLTAARDALLADGGSHVIEYRLEHADGRVVWVSEAANAVHRDGRLCCLRGLLTDITERRRLEESVAKSEVRLRSLLRGAPDALILTAADGTILNINDQAMYLLGYTLEEIRGSAVDLLMPERLRPRLARRRAAFDRDPARRTLVDGLAFAVERGDGHEVEVELSVSRVPMVGGDQFLYALRDITTRLRVEQQLEASERRIRTMANALPALVCFVDANERYRFVNETYATWARWERAEMEGRPVRDVMGAEVYEQARPFIKRALAGEAVHYYADVTGPSGVTSRVDVSYVPHREDGEVDGYFVVIVDAGMEGTEYEDVKDFRARPPTALTESTGRDEGGGSTQRVS